MFLYTDTEERARAAEKIVRELAVADELEAKMRLTRWDPDADEWVDPGTPRPQSETERVEEHREREEREEREAAATGKYDWELRVDLESLSETRELADRLDDKGIKHHRRWKHVLIPAATEEQAAELPTVFVRLAPGETEIHVEPAPGSIRTRPSSSSAATPRASGATWAASATRSPGARPAPGGSRSGSADVRSTPGWRP